MGDRFSQVAVLALVLNLTGSGLMVGLVMGARIIPYIILSPLGGRLADRYDRRTLMILTDSIRFPFALLFLFVETQEDLWVVYTAVIVLACGEAFYQPIRKSTISSLVEKESLLKVNALEQVMIGVVLILGSVTGGIVAFFLSPKVSFIINSLTFLVAALWIKKLPELKSNKKQMEKTKGESDWYRNLKPVIWFVLFVQFLVPITDGIFNVLITYYGGSTFGTEALGIGLLYGSLGIGLVISFYISARFNNRKFLKASLFFIIVEGVMQMLASQSASIVSMCFFFIMISAAGGVTAACLDSLVMEKTDPGHLGKVFGVIEAVSNIQIGIFMVAGGILIDSFEARLLGLYGGALNIALAVLFMLILVGSNVFCKRIR
ncbi:MFS transporter [Halobacillus sp. A1]|uniref:MFS transporter n=1 Tax=Halobacillus sp. A1 TaxID=2880262 RepID=UPI0020A6BE4C|nr:MFS transporter [Halobacillus sp. A1]